MATGGTAAAARQRGRRLDATARDGNLARVPSAGELAWIAALPCALVVLVLIVVLGPPLGDLLFPRIGLTFWSEVQEAYATHPEPTEQARYLLALTAPLLLTGCVLVGVRRARTLAPGTIALLVTGTQALALAFLATCYVVQRRYAFETSPAFAVSPYFSLRTIAVAALLALTIAAGLASRSVSARFGALTRERPLMRVTGTAVALAAIVVWLLPAINFENTIVEANEVIVNHLPFWLDEVFAALDGRFPLVDYAAQYGSLWPYPVAGAMTLLGASIGVFTIAMATISALALLALFATFRRVARGTLGGLLLFLPFLATSLYMMEGPFENRYAIANLFGTFPLRYAGPLLVAWLLARQLDGAAPRRARWLFLAAGLALLNNTDFGLPALGATLAALLWTGGPPTRRSLGRLALEAALGLAAALALVSALTLATAGSLPHLELLVRYARLFALAGWGMLPMKPTIGVSTIVYLTYVAAIGTATVRAVNDEPDRLMTGLLAWSGIFGLGAGSYYMGRSHPEVLTNMFGAWALSVTLLFVVAVRAIAARATRRPAPAEVACLFAFGVLACSLAQLPTPWSQVQRLQRTGLELYSEPESQPFVALHTRRGEAVAILTPLGHRVGYNLGLDDVTPYTGSRSMPTVQQLDETLAELRDAGGRKVFLSLAEAWDDLPMALVQRGYAAAVRERYGMAEFVRRR
jgi:hypothetical protein